MQEGKRVGRCSKRQILVDSGYLQSRENTAEGFIEPASNPFTLRATAFRPGEEGKFILNVYTEHPLRGPLEPLPPA